MTTTREELQKDIDELLIDVLAKAIDCAKKKIANGENLDVDNVILLLLLSQHNHLIHLRKTNP